ncbi:MAG TPA: AI-2E family transporter YdiK [Burkholderiaceae bacterium]|nr:AI-2E family transporter YdiK [Burkholderiaceae bacterium]
MSDPTGPSAAPPAAPSADPARGAAIAAAAGSSIPREPVPPPAAGTRMSITAPELTRTVLAILALIALIAGSLWVLQPFIPAIIWATTIVVATWPLMLAVQRTLWNRRSLAVATMTLALLLLFFVPLSLAIGTVVSNADTLVGWAKTVSTWRLGEAPAWLQGLPLVGPRAAQAWRELVAGGTEPLLGRALPYAGTVGARLLKEASALGAVGIQFLLTVAVAGVFYAYGEKAARNVLRFSRRLAGERGETTARLAADSIRGVALGVVVTAVAQSGLGGLALAIAGIPAATLLTAVMFLLAIAQVGPIPVLLPAAAWLFWSGDTGWAIFMLVATGVIGTMDNFIRPWLIKKGADLPLLLIFVGVVGGLVSFGLVGIFIGPVVLAVTWTLLKTWMAEVPQVDGTDAARGAAPTRPSQGGPGRG